MPQLLEVATSRIASFRRFKHFFRLHIQKAQTHRPMPHDALQMASPPAPAEVLLVVQRDYGVATFPNALRPRIAPIPDADSKRPNAHHGIQLPMQRGDAGGEAIRVVDDRHRRLNSLAAKLRSEHPRHPRAL